MRDIGRDAIFMMIKINKGGILMKKEAFIALGIDEETAKKLEEQTERELQQASSGLQTQSNIAGQYLKELNELRDKFKGVDVDDLKAEAQTWKERYETELGNKDKAVEAVQYDYAVKDALKDYNFTSDYARNGIEKEVRDKKLPVEDGLLKGIEEVMKELMEKHQDAFSLTEEVDDDDDDIEIKLPTKKSRITGKNPAKKTATMVGRVKRSKKGKSVDEYLDSKYKNNPYYTR